jgi:hypothetical protein
MKTENVDITHIHRTILSYLSKPTQPANVPLLVFPPSLWLQRMLQAPPSVDISYDFYILDTWEIVHRYKTDLSIPMHINFVKMPVTTDLPLSDLVFSYFDSLNRLGLPSFCSERPLYQTSNKCAKCNTLFVADPRTDNRMICPRCGVEIECSSHKINHNDSNRVNIQPKYVYIKRTHFLNCINQFQGKQKCDIQPALLDMIRDECRKYRLIDETQSTQQLQYQRVQKKHISMFLKEFDLSKQHYENINLIYHKITGVPLNDISHLTDKLLADFARFNERYAQIIPTNNRKNFNYPFLLYQLLLRHGYTCDPSEFNFLKTTERRSYHDELYQRIFSDLGWSYQSFFD